MYLDIPANDNLPEPCMATFKLAGDARDLRAVRLQRDGRWAWCAVTGWDESGPVAARIAPIEESGDGVALLLHGGPHGLRLAEIAAPADAARVRWDVADATQWAEPFLLVRPGTETA